MQMMNEFNNFKRNMTNDGARQEVQRLVQSGQISQAELNRRQMEASEFCKLFR